MIKIAPSQTEATMPDDTQPTPSSVPDAFAELAKALAAEAVSAPDSFKRAGTFREAVLKLAKRWSDGDPPHTVRGTKPALPAGGVATSSAPEAEG
jgi:hypothetical protein